MRITRGERGFVIIMGALVILCSIEMKFIRSQRQERDGDKSSSGTSEISFGVPAKDNWTDTSILLENGDTIVIEAAGSMNASSSSSYPRYKWVNPDGWETQPEFHKKNSSIVSSPVLGEGSSFMCLIGRIGLGIPFKVGSKNTITANSSGSLFLGMNDFVVYANGQSEPLVQDNPHWSQRVGNFTGTVTVIRHSDFNDYWGLVLLTGLGIFFAPWALPIKPSVITPLHNKDEAHIEGVYMNGYDDVSSSLIPQRWDEGQIELALRRSREQPNAISTYIDGIIDRFVARQNQKTAEQRTTFLRVKLQELNITYDVVMAAQRLKNVGLDIQIEVRKKDLAMMELEAQVAEIELRRQRALHEAQNLGKGTREPVREDYDFEA